MDQMEIGKKYAIVVRSRKWLKTAFCPRIYKSGGQSFYPVYSLKSFFNGCFEAALATFSGWRDHWKLVWGNRQFSFLNSMFRFWTGGGFGNPLFARNS